MDKRWQKKFAVYNDGTESLVAEYDEYGNYSFLDDRGYWNLGDVEVNGEKPDKLKWWQQYDPEKAEQARKNWNEWMPQRYKQGSNPYLFRQLGNTSSNSSTPKALQTQVLGGDEPWQKRVIQPNTYDGPDYNRDARTLQQFLEDEQKAEEKRQNLLVTFLNSNPQYKYYSPRTGNIVRAIPYSGTRHLELSEKDRAELKKIMYEQLSDYHLDKIQVSPMDIQYSFNDNFDRTEEEITTQREDASKTFLGSQKGGPRIRYIQDPVNSSAVIDLRHMLVVSQKGEFAGNSAELFQSFRKKTRPSSANFQDYYSNYLGYHFYKAYGNKLKQNPRRFAQYLYVFLNSNQYGRLETNGDINYYE